MRNTQPLSPLRRAIAPAALLLSLTAAWAMPHRVLAPEVERAENGAPANGAAANGDAVDSTFEESIRPILAETCFGCHGPAQQKADFRLDELDHDMIAAGNGDDWDYVLDLIRHGEMPPTKAERQFTDAEREAVIEWGEAELMRAARASEGEAKVVMRRLTRAQYTHTLQELLGINLQFGKELPSDAKSKTGFTNNGEVLRASPLHIETYQSIARAAIEQAIVEGERPAPVRYRARFGKGIGKDQVGGKTGGYQSVPLNTQDFVVDILDAEGRPRHDSATEQELETLDAIRKKISVGLRGSAQNRFRTIDDGLVLYGAVPHKEVAPGAWQGPSPNVKLEMQRVFPEQGDLAMRVRASRGPIWQAHEPIIVKLEESAAVAALDPELKVTGAPDSILGSAAKSDKRKNMTDADGVLSPTDVTADCEARVAVTIPAEGYYQVDLVHPPVPADLTPAIRLKYAGKTLDLRPEIAAEDLDAARVVTTIGAAYMRSGKQHVVLGGPFFTGFSDVCLTPLGPDHALVQELGQATESLEARFADRDPVLRAYAGTRTDDGMDYREFADAVEVTAPRGAAEEYTFFGRLEDLPIPMPDTGDNEILSGFLLLGVWNDNLVKDRRSPGPPLLIESIEVEAPYHPVWPPVSHTSIFVDSSLKGSAAPADESAYAREILGHFARRAFRTSSGVEQDVELYHRFWSSVRPECESFESAVGEALIAMLCSPRFLYMVEPDAAGDDVTAVAGEEALATRLSYFLWNGPPDARLRRLAEAGQLRAELEGEVDRLIDDPRSQRFVEAFAEEWLRLDRFEQMTIDADRFPKFTRFVKRDMRRETLGFLHHAIAADLPVSTLVDSDFVMLNQNLAEFYGIPGVRGPHMRPVEVPRSAGRGGLMSQGAFLAGHSDGQQPHAIKRAVWLKEKLLGDPPPPPPPNVPDLDKDDPKMEGLTLTEQLLAHRDSPSCRDCHAGIDPFGIAFERYNAVGLIEDTRNERPIDARTTLPDGTEVDGVVGMKAFLTTAAAEPFLAAYIEHLFAYALGRDVTFADEAELDAIREQVRANGSTLRGVLKAIVGSPSFLR